MTRRGWNFILLEVRRSRLLPRQVLPGAGKEALATCEVSPLYFSSEEDGEWLIAAEQNTVVL